MKANTLLGIADFLLKRLTHVEVEGAQHVPGEGPVILAINHLGLLDVALGFVAAGRADASGWVADEHHSSPLKAYLLRVVDGIWLDRENPDISSLRLALEYLKAGRLFGVAPEGTRSPTGALIQGKEGVAYLAAASGAPILPAGITGTENATQKLLRFTKPNLHIRFGETFKLPALKRDRREEQLAEGVNEIMCRIAALLPPKYRGVYADAPRLKELLGAST